MAASQELGEPAADAAGGGDVATHVVETQALDVVGSGDVHVVEPQALGEVDSVGSGDLHSHVVELSPLDACEMLVAMESEFDKFLKEAEELEDALSTEPLPEALLSWYRAEGVDVATLADLRPLARYARVPLHRSDDALAIAARLAAEVRADVRAVPWLAPLTFLRLPSYCKLKGAATYEAGDVVGMDAASGAAVLALGAGAGDRVLDLCCCPGGKLCALADVVGAAGAVDGVDVSAKRLAVARKLVDAYLAGAPGFPRVRLLRADGATFAGGGAVVFDSRAADGEDERKGRKRMNRSARAREAKRLKALADAEDVADGVYDRVLVDADCSTDGSFAHVAKMVRRGQVADLFAPERTRRLVSLQGALLANGFARLRPGGVLVYSTCSLARAQNEGVVAAFLAAAPDAALEAVPVVGAGSPGGLPHTVRFTAAKDDTSGLFVARIRKRAAAARGPCCVS